jgi:hypothetical protein
LCSEENYVLISVIFILFQDSWDDPEEEKKEEDSSKTQAVSAAKKPKKALLGKIEEKEVSFNFFLGWI